MRFGDVDINGPLKFKQHILLVIILNRKLQTIIGSFQRITAEIFIQALWILLVQLSDFGNIAFFDGFQQRLGLVGCRLAYCLLDNSKNKQNHQQKQFGMVCHCRNLHVFQP